MAVSRSVSVVLSAKVDQFKADMAAAGKSAMDAAQKTETAWDKSSTGAGKAMQTIGQYRDEMTTVGASLATFGGVVVGSLGLATKAAVSWESAWTGVLKTVDGSPKQLAEVEKGLRGLAKTLPATHEEIAAVAEAAGQLGIKTDNVVAFTKTMIDMGESTNLSAEDAATSLARLANIMGTSQKNFGKMGASIVGLGNNFATTEREIVDMSLRIAAVGKQSGLTEGQVFGLATALSSVGIEAEAGGTAISMVMKKITNEVGTGGDKLDEFARIAGMSSEQFAQAWETDAAGALDAFIAGLGRADESGENVNQTLSALGITGIRESDSLLRLAGASDVLSNALRQGNEEYEKGTALAEEAAKRYETAESKIKIAGNSLKDTAITIGGTFLPALASIAEAAAQLASDFGNLPEPVLKVSGALAAIAGTAALAGGAALILVPKIAESVTAFNTLRTAVADSDGVLGKFAGKGRGVAQAATAAAGAIAVLAAAGAIADVFAENVIETQKLTNELTALSSKAGVTKQGLDDLIATSGSGGAGIEGFGDALDAVNQNGFVKWLDSAASGFGLMDSETGLAEEAIKNMDQTMATFASTGSMEQLSQSFSAAVESAKGFGYSAEDIIAKSPQLQSALIDQATAMGLGADNATLAKIALGEITGPAGAATDAIGGVGGAANDAAGGLKEMLDGLLSLGIVQQTEMEAMASYEGAIDSVAESIKENGRSLDITTEKGRANQDALFGIANAGRDAAGAMAENGASQEQVQGQLQRTYDDLVRSGKQFGLSGDKAAEMARKVLGIPDDVDVKTWMSNAAEEQAKKTQKAIDGIDKNVKIKVQVTKDDPFGLYQPGKGLKGPGPWKDGYKPNALGGILTPMAAGGFAGAEMVAPNTWRIVGDRMDVDEAYVPLDGSKRSWKILMEALDRMPGAIPMAKGGVLSGSSKADAEQRKLERDRLQAIRELQAELRTDMRRGNLREQVTGGLSGGYSAVDRLAGLGSNEDLSKGSRSRANTSARKFEASLKKLFGQAEQLDEKIKDAKEKAQELEGIQKSVSNGLLSGRKLDVGDYQNFEGGQWSTYSGVGGATRRLTADVGKMKAFAGKLQKLAGMGIPGSILQEIAGAGVDEGSTIADAFLGASKAERNSYVGAWKDYEKYANQAGQYVTEGFYTGGVNAAQGVVRGLEGQKRNVESAIANLAKTIESTFKSVLGIRSPSTVMAEAAFWVPEAARLQILDAIPGIESAAGALGAAMVPGMSDLSMDIGMTPVVSDDEGRAGLAMQDMSTTTLDAMTAMQMTVSEGWAAMLAQTQTSQLGMLTTTQAQQEAMRATIAEKQLGSRTTVTSEQELMRSIMAEKQMLMRTQNLSDFEAMRYATVSKLGQMRAGSNETMSGFREDYSGHLGNLRESNRAGFTSMRDTSNSAFDAIRSGMNAEMRGARPELGNNLNRLISVFASFTAEVNKAFGDVGVKLKAPGKLEFASGGVMPGYTPGRDVHSFYSPTAGNLYLSGGEAIMRPEWTKAMGGEAAVKAQNDAARQGRLDDLLHMQETGAYASGGVIPAIPGVNAFADAGVWRGLWGIVKKNIPGAIKTSGYRPGSITASGNRSYHSRGMAVDMGGPMRKIFDFLYNNYRNSNEIIYSPANSRQIKNGSHYMYQGAVRRMHFNHVHWANSRIPGGGAADMSPGAFGDDDMFMPPSHPFLDRAGVSAGGNLGASYEQAAKKLTQQIYAKHSKMLPGGIGGQLGKGIMSKVSEGLVDKAKEYGKTNAAGGGADFSDVASGPIKDMARQMLEKMGWSDQFGDLNWLLNKESGWRPNAQNPKSSAYGLFQFLDGTWAGVGGRKTSDPKLQLEYGLKYIKQRYGDIRGARRFWERNNWYKGGTQSAKSGLAVVGEDGPELINMKGGERVHNAAETRKMLAANRTYIPNTGSGAGIDYDRLAEAVVANLPPSLVVNNDNAGLIEDRIAQKTVQNWTDTQNLYTTGVIR